MALRQPSLFLGPCSSMRRKEVSPADGRIWECSPTSQASCPLWVLIFINTKLRVKRPKIRWLNHCNDLSYFCYLKARLPLCVYALGYVKPWFRVWTFLLVPFTKFWAMPFADYSPNSVPAGPYPHSWFLLCILKIFSTDTLCQAISNLMGIN